MANDTIRKCSFCGKPEDKVRTLFQQARATFVTSVYFIAIMFWLSRRDFLQLSSVARVKMQLTAA